MYFDVWTSICFVNEQKQQNVMQQQTIDAERKSFEDRFKREVGTLKEQLQVLLSGFYAAKSAMLKFIGGLVL